MSRLTNGRRVAHVAWARTFLRAAVLGATLIGTGGALADDPAPPPERLMDQHVQAAGGREALEKLRNRVSTGTFEYSSGAKGKFTVWNAAPNKSVLQAEGEGMGKITEGTDGEVAWVVWSVEGARIKEGVEAADSIRRAHFNAELHWRRLYRRAETLGEEIVGEKPAWRAEFTPDQGRPTIISFDRESGLIVKYATQAETPMGVVPVEIVLSDYRPVDGVLLPHKLVQTIPAQVLTMTTEKIEHNVELPGSKFDLPIEIRQLQERRARPDGG